MGFLHAALIVSALAPAPQGPGPHQVRSLRVTVLSTMLTDLHGVGEWGAIGSSFSLEGGIDPLTLAR